MKLLFVTNHSVQDRPESDMTKAFARNPSIRVVVVPTAASEREVSALLPPLCEFDGLVFFLKARQMIQFEVLPGQGFDGIRVLMDHDALRDQAAFDHWGQPNSMQGEWVRMARRFGLDLIVVSGLSTAEHLASFGVDVAVVHKGVDTDRFFDKGIERTGLGHFGSPYLARRGMLAKLDRASIPVVPVSVLYSGLNDALNSLRSTVICNMGARVRLGLVGRALERIRPNSQLLALTGAPEPMMKNFESAAAGCVTFMDDVPDLHGLGFIEGETAVVYEDFDGLIDRIRYFADKPERLDRIGAAGGALCRERHGWEHRAVDLVREIGSRISVR